MTHFSKSLLVVLAATGVAAVATGCGSSDSATLTHGELVSKANAACQTANAKVAALPTPTKPAELAVYATKTSLATTALEKELAALSPPKSDRLAVASLVAGLRKSNTVLDELIVAAKAGNTKKAQALADQLQVAGVGVLAARAGLGVCATSVTPKAS